MTIASLPDSCPDFPSSTAEFSPEDVGGLRVLLLQANTEEDYEKIVPELDPKSASKFARGQTWLDYRSMGPDLCAVYEGVYAFYKRRAPQPLLSTMHPQLGQVYAPRFDHRVEAFIGLWREVFRAPAYDSRGPYSWLPGTYWIYRFQEVAADRPTIAKILMQIEPREHLGHCFLRFEMIYPLMLYGIGRRSAGRAARDDELRRIRGVVLPKHRQLFFMGSDSNGDVPFEMVSDDPMSRATALRATLRPGAAGGSSSCRSLIVKRPEKARGSLESFRGLSAAVGVFAADEIIVADGLEDWIEALSIDRCGGCRAMSRLGRDADLGMPAAAE